MQLTELSEIKANAYTNEFEFGSKYKIDFVPDDAKEMASLLGVESDDFYHIPIQPISLKWKAVIYAAEYAFEGMDISVPDQTVSVKVQVDRNGEVIETKDFELKNVQTQIASVVENQLEVMPNQIIWSANKSFVEFK